MEKNIKLIPKQEIIENKSIIEDTHNLNPSPNPNPIPTIDLSSSSDSDSGDDVADGRKKRRIEEASGLILPLGFLDPLPTKELTPLALPSTSLLPVPASDGSCVLQSNCKQFWKAGDYEVAPTSRHWDSSSGGMDHVRVHPKFLHSNATSHKWVLGAFAELLDNSLDEVCNGATYVNIDMILNKKDGSRMLLIDDDGGGMNPDKMRQCMSLGYSAKSKMADTIGQYGNGFKTSTMRLGADVIVFSRCCGSDGNGPTESIGLLSYTFLMSTGKEDIVVPMLDYEKRGQEWSKIVRSSVSDWNKNVETIVQWSPFASEADLLRQFNQMKNHGTRIIIYNLWEDDERLLELDFDADPHDIQIRGVNRDEKNIQMAKLYPNSRHFLTYRHSLRSYASILYLRIPPGFRMILRGKDVEHHNIVNDMMMTQEVTYRPQPGADGVHKDANMVAIVTVGFVKDAKAHIDVQGFNVYHKNRLIKPFWRLWHPPGSDGRGVIGVLEANFVEPAHDKQGFERTTVLSRLEARLVQMQKTYWTTNCHKIGYAPRRYKKANLDRESSPECTPNATESKRKNSALNGKSSASSQKQGARVDKYANPLDKSNGNNGHLYNKADGGNKTSRQRGSSSDLSSPSEEYLSDADVQSTIAKNQTSGYSQKSSSSKKSFVKDGSQTMHTPPGFKRTEAEQKFSSDRRSLRSTTLKSKGDNVSEPSPSNSDSQALHQLREENRELRERVKRKEEEMLGDLLRDLQQEKERCKSLESQLEEATRKIEAMNKEQENLIDIFAEERQRRDLEEENLRKKLKEASHTIQELLNKVKVLENKTPVGESDRQWKR